jgi:hypothetical protein
MMGASPSLGFSPFFTILIILYPGKNFTTKTLYLCFFSVESLVQKIISLYYCQTQVNNIEFKSRGASTVGNTYKMIQNPKESN